MNKLLPSLQTSQPIDQRSSAGVRRSHPSRSVVSPRSTDDRVNLLNISVHDLSQQELLEALQYGGVVFTPNLDHLSKLQCDPEFYKVYQSATYRVCDSQILMYAARLLGQPLQEKISGSDLLPAFCDYYRDDPEITIFLLGGMEGVPEQARERINQKVGREMVVETYSPPYGFEKDEQECEKIIELINRSGATTLAVGLGAPKQELWIARYKLRFDTVKIFLAVGAALDFEAGSRSRSPQWMSKMGLEWTYRLALEPKRLWKRYLVDDLPVLWHLLQQKFNRYQVPASLRHLVERNKPTLPIGTLLQEAGLLTEEQVLELLDKQTYQRHLLFGELAVKKKLVKPATADFFVEEFPQLCETPGKYRLGEYLKTAALLDQDQIRFILDQQSHTNLLFGEIAIQQGWLKPKTVEFFLETLKRD